MTTEERILDHLVFLYGREAGERTRPKLKTALDAFRQRNPEHAENTFSPESLLTERDVFLITYGDQTTEPGKPPLQTLAEFLDDHLMDSVGGVHLLPHFPYSSDDGFSVMDYLKVDPHLGDWSDVRRLGKNYRLMFDGVINHISRQSDWFQKFLRDEPPYNDYFIVCDINTDLSAVVRPRTSPLLTPVETASGTKHVWTTFSDDQIDLNFQNPRVLLEIIKTLLFYVERGAEVIRLDAIAYLWKEIGTPCIHLPQTHRVVKLFRAVLNAVAPGVMLITETNVPHSDNISYFGDGTDEAQMVYNFALPPLVLHALHTGNATALSKWAATLKTPSPSTTFFNFIASHDGIGVTPARGLLSESEITDLVERTLAHGGNVSYKSNSDGSKSPYELNITLYDALTAPNDSNGTLAIRRFLASQAIMLSLAGVPGIYFHSLFGSRNWREGAAQTGRARTINRQKFQKCELEAELSDVNSLKRRVFDGYRQLLRARRSCQAFHPNAAQRILDVGDEVFALERVASNDERRLVFVVNVTSQPQQIALDLESLGIRSDGSWQNLLDGGTVVVRGEQLLFDLEAYELKWLVC